MSGAIFVLQDNGQLVEMNEQGYVSEAFLQELLAKYPSLMAGEQIDPVTPRKWLLISREMAVPDQEDGAGRWSVDHLFLDQDAIPTIVEVKRSSDTRIRREVVGQMLDYAANAVVYWPVESIRARFETNCQIQATDADQQLVNSLGLSTDIESFWHKVKTNLQAGKIRMLFVADEIPAELRRIVEFLNEQMDPAEVLAIEVKQYVGQGLKTLVPRVIGQTAEAQQRKSRGEKPERQWDEASFFTELSERTGRENVEIARKIYQWANPLYIWWGKGQKSGSFFPMVKIGEKYNYLFSIWTNGSIDLQFQPMASRQCTPFNNETMRLELLQRLNRIPGIDLPADSINRRPSLELSVLAKEEVLNQFLEVFKWVVSEYKDRRE